MPQPGRRLHEAGPVADDLRRSQRQRFRRETLAAERISILESIDGWVWDPKEAAFQEGLARLEQFTMREGHARVPARHRECGHHLGTWVFTRRREFKNRELASTHVAALESLEGWVWDPMEAEFQVALGLLKEYVAREGHARVPRSHREGELNLGSWVHGKRQAQKKGKLSAAHRASLECVRGWVWDAGTGASHR
jgi:hypothetical protein